MTECPYRSRQRDSDRIPRRAATVAYAEESYRREDKTFAAPSVRFTTAKRAMDYLDRIDVPGDVSVWVERTQRREFIARRRADGTWIKNDGFGRWTTPDGVEVLTNAPEFSLWSGATA